jgi:O-antigen/teichoic acid export membrane protein
LVPGTNERHRRLHYGLAQCAFGGLVADSDPIDARRDAGARAAGNTAARAAGEIAGKLASLVLFAVLAREVGASELGVFVFAFAWVQLATIPIGLGLDRYLLRRLAQSGAAADQLFFNALYLKLTRAVPIALLSFALLFALDYGPSVRTAVYILTPGLILDSVSRTMFALFTAREQGGLIAGTVTVQRVGAAALGLAALALGGGVIAVCATFTVGTAIGVAVGFVLMSRAGGVPERARAAADSRELRVESRPFALTDVLGTVLARLDAVLLSLLATSAAVGRYGAAYRLLEATFFISSAVTGAFTAMYARLSPTTEPTLRASVERSTKLTLALLVPPAVLFAGLAEPLGRFLFGRDLEGAADPLRVLAPVVVLYGLATIGSTLAMVRLEPRTFVRANVAAVVVNVGLNLALIPPLDELGAAVAMLVTFAVFAAMLFGRSASEAGGLRWAAMLAGPLVAGCVMAAALLPLRGSLAAATAVSSLVYVVVLYGLERALNPRDVEFVADLVRRRLSRA